MRFDLITLFPEMFSSPMSESILGRAVADGFIELHFHNPRDFTTDKHRSVDDAPYGGGAGMVMRVEPLTLAIESIPRQKKSLCILLSPQGETFTQEKAEELAPYDQLLFVCGRYEGIDERVKYLVIDREFSVGDFVVSGGELPAMLMMDAITRLLPQVLWNPESLEHESFQKGLLESPHYTRPVEFRGKKVPEVLLSGDHKKIELWRKEQSELRTATRRPDLFAQPRRIDKPREKG